MTHYELVAKTIKGENPGQVPIYAWVRENLEKEISAEFGSVEAFEDHYDFDLAHIFGGPSPFSREVRELKTQGTEITPEILLDLELNSPDNMQDYSGILQGLEFYKKRRGRFCYVQTNGFFECYNDIFGIENHLMYLALYPDEIKELYSRQAKWNMRFAGHCVELGADMIHISDDWGAQNSLLFSPDMFRELIMPYHRQVVDFVKSKNVFVSLHSDGCIREVLDEVADIGYDVVHPYQESAGMSYDGYLARYSDKFGIMGGLCVQSALGFNKKERLTDEIRRVFSLLKGKRFICCTTHFVQNHCTIDELTAAYDLIAKLR